MDTWDAVQAVHLLSEHMVAAALAGVSTRNYPHAALERSTSARGASDAEAVVSVIHIG
ncbi:MAG: hypothetical protein AB7G23_19990 [Vicinamibacterales bacterium]